MRNILLFIVSMGFMNSINAQIVINEYSCSNINTVTDAYGQYEDWVELFNAGAVAVNLTGYYLSDDPQDLMKWQIPAIGNTAAGGRNMVYCSDRGLVNGSQIHPSFRLTQTKGEWFILSNAAGVIIDSVHLRLTQRGHSRGRTTDGANSFSLFTTPSPNGSNGTSTPYLGYATKPLFSLAPGFYTSAQSVVLSSPDPNVTIYYTINGATPTAASTPYSTPIAVNATMVIRAVAISSTPGIAPSFTETNTYLINENTTFNVISVAGPFTTTLFTWGSQPIGCSFEFFDQNKNFILEYEGRAQRHGHDSWAYPQKGFKVYAQDEYGYKHTMDHKFFRTSLRDEFDMLILKAGASDNYPGGPTRACHMRDMFAHTLAEKYNLDMDYRRYEPTIVFVNGQYWGVYEIRERVDKDYFDYYYGQSEKHADNIRYWGGTIVGPGTSAQWASLVNFIFNNSMTIPANYNYVTDSLNVKSFAQYFIFNQYLVNTDWLNWNTQWWRGRNNPKVKWRYALWDEDNILDLGQNYTGVGTTTYNNDPCDPISLFPGSTSIPHTSMLDSLLKNPDFKQMYDQQWIDMLNGVFKCENILAHFDSCYALLLPEMPRQIARWGGTMADWQNNIQYMRNQIVNRCAVIGGKIDTCLNINPQELILNVDPPGSGVITMNNELKSPYIWRKVIDADSTYTLKGIPTAGQYWAFDYWEKKEPTNIIAPGINSDQIQYTIKKKDSVVAHFKYFNYDSVNVTFDVNPPGTGRISLNGNILTTYPVTLTLDRRFTYNLEALPEINHLFLNWSKNNSNTVINPAVNQKKVDFTYVDPETITANFEFIPPPPPPPPIPNLSMGDIEKQVFIPNVFSPNQDGKNDIFTVRIGKDIIGVEMFIYDRWGKQVYHSSDLNKGWDGTYDGKAAEVGSYAYLIQVRVRDGRTKSFKGDLTLLR